MPATLPPTDPREQLQWLVDREAVRDLVVAFGLAVDDKDRVGYALNFVDDGVLELPFGRFVGAAAIAAMPGPPADWRTWHLFGQVVVDVDGDTATARAYTYASHVFDPQDRTKYAGSGGWYRFEARRTAEGWRLSLARLMPVWESARPMLPGPRPTTPEPAATTPEPATAAVTA